MRLQRSIEPFNDNRLGLLFVCGEIIDAGFLEQSLSVCNAVGATSTSSVLNAATIDDADLFFSGTHHTCFEKTSITVNRKVMLSLSFQFRHVDEIGPPLLVPTSYVS